MRKLIVLSSAVLWGCVAASPLPPKKEVVAPPASAANAPVAPMPQDMAHGEILETQQLPRAERISTWRTWAADKNQPQLQIHALTQLHWLEDPEQYVLATKALESPDSRVRVTAARVLAHAPSTPNIRTALLEILPTAANDERNAILWSLVMHGEKSIASKALDELRNGVLQKVTDLDGRNVFEASTLALLFTADELKHLAKDKSSSARQMVALYHARHPSPQATETLLELSKDVDDLVNATAIGGLARSADKRGRDAVLEALRNGSQEQTQTRLEAIRDLAGGPGLVLALEAVPAKPEEAAWFRTKQIFDMLESLADPRSADPLFAWASASKRHPHWLGETGRRLAEVGDLRGAKFIGDRLRLDPNKVYVQEHFWEADAGGHLTRTDLPRIAGARMLADLAVIHPDNHAELLAAAENNTLDWLKNMPQPHGNGMRFLAQAGSNKVLNDLRTWAFPSDPLPKKGAMPPFPVAFETAQSALRYIGLRKDEPSFLKLLEQLQRKEKTLNVTQEALMESGISMLGMALRAIGYGASSGLAHWSDPRAVAPLMTFIEDETWHEEARQAACEALAWCADGEVMADIAKKASSFGQSKEPAKKLIGMCYAQTFSLRSVPEISAQLAESLSPNDDADLRMAYAKALGMSGFNATSREKLFGKLDNPATRQAAALALVLGGYGEIASRAITKLATIDPSAMKEFKDHYYRAFGYWNELDFGEGNIYRWVMNAEAIRHVEVSGKFQDWAQQRLESQFANLRFDNGPRSETRVVLRHHLWQDAKKGFPERQRRALMTLVFMQERGVLMALRDEPGELGILAGKALHRLMNPIVIPE